MESAPTDDIQHAVETKQTEPDPSSYTAEDEAYMRLALQVAERALQLGEVPVGCVIVWDNPKKSPSSCSVVVSHGANQVNATRDATRHGEIVAIDRLLTRGRSSDALRLDPSVLTQSARSDMLPADSPLLPANQTKLEACWADQWVNVPDDAEHWKNSYGWGTGRVLSEDDLPHCRLYVSQPII
eukprot:scaffold3028_cov174-Amphora_coffeaeformis.AAC.27